MPLRASFVAVVGLLGLCAVGQNSWAAQDAIAGESASRPEVKLETPAIEAIPDGEVKVLQAIVMEVKGKARWRPNAEAAWKDVVVNDVLDSGAEIRTALRSSVGLRVGKNATVLIDSGTNFVLPEVVQEGSVLKTRAAVKSGRADFKVDHVGLTNDFQVITPSSTLAVRGTGFGVEWGALAGSNVTGLASNRINAIEIRYFLTNLMFFVSGAAKSGDKTPPPVQAAWMDTVGTPVLIGQIASSEEFRELLEDGFALTGGYMDQKAVQQAADSLRNTFMSVGGEGTPIGNDHPDPGMLTNLQKFQNLCLQMPQFVPEFFQTLDSQMAAENNGQGLQPGEMAKFATMVAQLEALCANYGDGQNQTSDPLQEFISKLNSFCNDLESPSSTEICLNVTESLVIGYSAVGQPMKMKMK